MSLTPSIDRMSSFAPGWMFLVLLRNYALALAVFGAWHLWLCAWRKQDSTFKFQFR